MKTKRCEQRNGDIIIRVEQKETDKNTAVTNIEMKRFFL